MFSEIIEYLKNDVLCPVFIFGGFVLLAIGALLLLSRKPSSIKIKCVRVHLVFFCLIGLYLIYTALAMHESILLEALRVSGAFGGILYGPIGLLLEVLGVIICIILLRKTRNIVVATKLTQAIAYMSVMFATIFFNETAGGYLGLYAAFGVYCVSIYYWWFYIGRELD